MYTNRLLACLLLVGAQAALVCHAAGDRNPAWAALTPAQQESLAPLRSEWAAIEANRKQKWLELAGRFPSMAPEERQRVQARMSDWAKLTPTQRADARMQFQEARLVPADERQARWQAYQALPAAERQSLALRAAPSGRQPAPGAVGASAGATSRPYTERTVIASRAASAPAASPLTRAVAPAVMQATPGATTTTMSTRAAPPPHHQTGLPKIAATPGFVDPTTLLPQRGPQGAAIRAAATSNPGPAHP